ncbi:Alpha/Beta hydrolase protein [Aspergillus pseudodeflectus]|uniref:Carboxylic ester hydrolase n=1 Tax=Aspergillus pseudodeflectus TaxID=176178 RepID=A0ABR4JF45_9EURO
MKILVASLLPLASWASELTVSTTSGTVQGFYNDSSAQTVRAFLGIPYAEPPVGIRRWAPPVPKKSLKSWLDAHEFGPSCPLRYSPSDNDIYSVLPYSPPHPDYISEDCLSLNIWAPSRRHTSLAGRSKEAAVLVFIHGGAFVSGTSAVPFYDGAPFVRDNENVIIVTLNYRLGIFGYPNAPGLPVGKQNVGLLDQRLAVKWLRDNISQFGGDPKRITLLGQSAGAISADMYVYAYHMDPLVHGIVMQSGTAALFSSSDFTHSGWQNVSETLGCTQRDPARNLKCMRELPVRDVLQAAVGQLFVPVQDNITVFSNYSHRAELGKLAKIPVLVGSNAQESFTGPLDGPGPDKDTAQALTTALFTCPADAAARARRDHHIPSWRYLYHGNWTNLSPVPWLGELPLVFGTYNLSQPTLRDQVLASKYVQGAWAAFAHDPHDGLSAYGWPLYDAQDSTLVSLALDNRPDPVFTKDPLAGLCGSTN